MSAKPATVDEPWTIRAVLQWMAEDFAKRGIESARLDAELLLAHALGIDRIGLYLDLDRPLSNTERATIRALVARRREREPIAYILERKEFYGRTFAVNDRVLVPRPDTETLAEQALALLERDAASRVLDIGTGSGVLAITIALERPRVEVTAVDACMGALAVAQRNAEHHGVADRIKLQESDLFEALRQGEEYDLIISNPPYIPDETLATLPGEISRHEPRVALSGGEDGLDVVRRILAEGAAWLRSGGNLLIEVGDGQAESVKQFAAGLSVWSWQGSHRDLNDIARVAHLLRQ